MKAFSMDRDNYDEFRGHVFSRVSLLTEALPLCKEALPKSDTEQIQSLIFNMVVFKFTEGGLVVTENDSARRAVRALNRKYDKRKTPLDRLLVVMTSAMLSAYALGRMECPTCARETDKFNRLHREFNENIRLTLEMLFEAFARDQTAYRRTA